MELFWEALLNIWDIDHSAARGHMACRGLYIFSHEKLIGNSPAHNLFDQVNILRGSAIEIPRSIHDYNVAIRVDDLPNGVDLTQLAP
jgi:CRISPR-associated protein Csd2